MDAIISYLNPDTNLVFYTEILVYYKIADKICCL